MALHNAKNACHCMVRIIRIYVWLNFPLESIGVSPYAARAWHAQGLRKVFTIEWRCRGRPCVCQTGDVEIEDDRKVCFLWCLFFCWNFVCICVFCAGCDEQHHVVTSRRVIAWCRVMRVEDFMGNIEKLHRKCGLFVHYSVVWFSIFLYEWYWESLNFAG